MIKLGDKNSKHQYEIGVFKDGRISYVIVDANTRTQATSITKKAGYVVRDVNMIG